MITRIKLIALVLLGILLTPTVAQAFDIPLLTWERGREQQVVLGGGAYSNDWKVTLEGSAIDPLTFSASQKNAAGYIVYTLVLPDDLPTGPYSIVTNGSGSPRTVVAGVNVIAALTKTVTSSPFALTLILATFVFLTGIVSTIRARKYLYIPFKSEQQLPRLTDAIVETRENFWTRLEAAPYRVRVRAVTSLNQSLLRFLLIREGELSHRISRGLYGVTPLVGLIAGIFTSVTISRNGGIAATSMTIFLVVTAIAILDGLAGVSATLGFWAIQLVTGQVSSIQELLITCAVGFAWVGPSLFAGLLREVINRDFKASEFGGESSIKLLGIFGSSFVGAATFYLGQALVNSVIYTEQKARSLTWIDVAIVAAALIIRGFAESIFFARTPRGELRDESFYIARTNSPATAFAIMILVYAFVNVWSDSATRALMIAVIFALPYFFSFIRFNPIEALKSERIPRNILLESALLSVIAFIIFRQVSVKPLLTDQRADLMLMLSGIAPALHSIYSAIYSSNEEKFSFTQNQEIIEP